MIHAESTVVIRLAGKGRGKYILSHASAQATAFLRAGWEYAIMSERNEHDIQTYGI